MVRKVCKGLKTQKIYIEDEEAAVHRYLNKLYSSYSTGSKEKLVDPVLPEPMEIRRVKKIDKNT